MRMKDSRSIAEHTKHVVVAAMNCSSAAFAISNSIATQAI